MRPKPTVTIAAGTINDVRACILIVSPDDDPPPQGEAMHVLCRSEAAALLRAWRRKGRPCGDRSPHPIICAIIWRLTEALRVDPDEAATPGPSSP